MKRLITAKALGLGLAGALLICVAAYPNDYLVESNLFVGNHLPVAVFFLLFLFCLLVRPLLSRLPAAFHFSNRDLTVAVVIMLAACSLPTSSLMRYFPTMLTVPYDLFATRQHWQTNRALSFTPRKLVPEGWYIEGEDPELDRTLTPKQRLDKARRAEFVNKGLRNGIVSGNRFVWFWPSGSDRLTIPLRSWFPLLRYWAPAILFFLAMLIGIVGVVHPQWSRNELLPYPIADFTTSILHADGGRPFPALFYKRIFWIGFGITAFIHLVRFVYRWYPDTMINIPLEWRLGYLVARKFPNFYYHGGDIRYVFNGHLYLSVLAFAFFVPTEVSFSLGITAAAMGVATYALWGFGYSYTSYNHSSTLFGAYLGMFAIIVYLGRRYYRQVFQAALGIRTSDPVAPDSRAAARMFLVGFAGLTAMGTVMGLPVYLSLVLVTLLLVLFVVVARITAETGNPFIQAHWYPMEVISRLLGPAATGPRTLSVSTLLSRILAQDVRECLSSFWVNGLRMADNEGVPRGRLSSWVLAFLVPCAAVAFLAAIWVNYNGRGSDGWGLMYPPRMTYDSVAAQVTRLRQEPGLLEKVVEMEKREGVFSPAALGFRLRHVSLQPGVLPWIIAGLVSVLACSFLRIRYTWWFIHPVLFLAWGNYATNMFSASFFFGSAVKWAVVKYGGGRVYQDLKPFFMGVIMGELAMGGVALAFNLGYFWVLGVKPVRYMFLPG